MSNKKEWSEITGDELKQILNCLKEWKNDLSSFEIDQIPLKGSSFTGEIWGKGLSIKLIIERK